MPTYEFDSGSHSGADLISIDIQRLVLDQYQEIERAWGVGARVSRHTVLDQRMKGGVECESRMQHDDLARGRHHIVALVRL